MYLKHIYDRKSIIHIRIYNNEINIWSCFIFFLFFLKKYIYIYNILCFDNVNLLIIIFILIYLSIYLINNETLINVLI